MMVLLNHLFLVVAIVLSLVTFFKIKKKKNNSVKIYDTEYKILFITIAIIGLLIRLWKFGIVPYGINQDGAMAAVDGFALARYGTDRFGTWMPAHLYAWGYGQMSSMLSYLIAFFVKFLGLNIFAVRLPQLLASIMGGIFFYLFMKDIFGKKIGLIAAFFVAINPWHFLQSRWALDCNLLPHFFMGGLYFLNKGLSGKRKNIYISMIFFGLSMYCYGLTIYTVPLFLLAVAIYYYIRKKLTIKEILVSIGIYLLIAWPFILTMLVNLFKWNTIKLPFVTIQYFPDSIRSNDILFFSDKIGKQLLLNFQSLIDVTFLQKRDLLWNNISDFGTMYLFTMPFVIIGIIGLLKEKADGNKALIIFALLTGIWVGITTNEVNINRINIIYYTIMMLAVIGIYLTIKKIKYAGLIIPIMYSVFLIFLINTYFTSYAKNIGKYFYAGFGDALIAAENLNVDYIIVSADVQLKGHPRVSEILTLFYDKIDAKYFQEKTNINNGREYLPYNERYKYYSITSELIEENKLKDVGYVIRNVDKELFNIEEYNIECYANYCTIIKK